MEKTPKRYLITAALPYANGPLHIGHLAGAYIPADIYVRYQRMRGRDAIWICGSDEHGVPITIRARQEGTTPQAVVDKYHALIKQSFEDFGMSFDIYSRTSSPTHHQTAADFFKRLYDEGVFIEQETDQYYDTEAQQFLADRYIMGTCPHCGNERAYGDQCERCGSSLSPADLQNPRSMLSGSQPVLRATKHWFLPLDRYQPTIQKWILEDHKEWKANVYGQCKSWLDQGLQPRAVSRDLPWGVPVPLPNAEGKVLYVWFDAPIGYISATKELTLRWEEYWKSPDTKLVHFIGKDNIVFHCIVFPTMLMAHGGYILPDNVPANEFLNLEGEKISTSRNWAVWLHEYLEDFPGMQDVLRYTLTANMPETKDNDFTWRDYQSRNNSELVAILGNFINRALVLAQKYYQGIVPTPANLEEVDRNALAQIELQRHAIEHAIETYHFRDALREYMQLARVGNKYLADLEPWKIAKQDPARCEAIIYTALQISAALSALAQPFLPFTAERMQRMHRLPSIPWDNVAGSILPSGHQLGEPELLFSRIEDETIERQLQKLHSMKAQQEESQPRLAPKKNSASFEHFEALDLRVGTVLEAEPVPKTQKLLKLLVDTGHDRRTIVSGIAEHFTPESLIGKQVSLVLNLEPRTIRGIRSEGMLIFAQTPDGALRLLQPTEGVPNGSTIG